MSVMLLDASVLSDDEQAAIESLDRQRQADETALLYHDAYYRGTQRIENLKIAVPDKLAGLRTIVAWPTIAVDAVEERLDIEGFRYPDAPDGDRRLGEIWQANNLDEESQLAHLDALVFGRAYACVGTGACGTSACPPLITVESPLQMAAAYDTRSRALIAALRRYEEHGTEYATLYTPEATVFLAQPGGTGEWEIIDRDDHRLGVVPVVRIINRGRTSDRWGSSEITPAVRSLTDSACRTLVGAELAREFFAAPQRYVLGASEDDFKDAEGNPVPAWESYIGRYLAIGGESDEKLPTVGQFAAGSPAAFSELLRMYAQQFAAATGLPPHYIGYSTDNPTSAEAIANAEMHLVKRVERRQRAFGGSWEDVMRLALLIADGTKYDSRARSIETLWRDASTPTKAAQAAAVLSLVGAGVLPAESSVALDYAGFTKSEQQRIALDRQRSTGRQALSAITQRALARRAAGNGAAAIAQ